MPATIAHETYRGFVLVYENPWGACRATLWLTDREPVILKAASLPLLRKAILAWWADA